MKQRITYLAIVLLALTSLVVAQSSKDFTKAQVDNLIAGIKSDNPGVQKSSIYLAGYYKVTEATDAIKEEMNSSVDPSVKVLAALTLYEIDSATGMDDILSLAKDTTVDPKVKNLAEAIHDYWKSKRYALTTITK